MKITIVTGLSGAGKTQALKILEDLGFMCVDNLPPSLIGGFLDWAEETRIKRPVAIGIDVRTPSLEKAIDEIKKREKNIRILFLEADKQTLINRFKTTRRKHPIPGSLSDAISKEIRITNKIKKHSDIVVDTTNLTLQELKHSLGKLFWDEIDPKVFKHFVQITTFGYRFGIPLESDLVFDVRFLKNPNYVKKLKYLTGLNKSVRDYVFNDSVAKKFLELIKKLLTFLIPNYIREGKSYLTISFGCTGGHHRSVAVGVVLAKFIRALGYEVKLTHRDIDKPLGE